jgi:hypothetical protein
MKVEYNPYEIDSLEKLETLFGKVSEASLKKEVPSIHPLYQAWIEASPFVVLATVGPSGLDVSPRGDLAGFVLVQDEKTLLLPERRGNNRVDRKRLANSSRPTINSSCTTGELRLLGVKAKITSNEATDLRWFTLAELKRLQPTFEDDVQIIEQLTKRRKEH